MNRSHAVAERNNATGDDRADWPTPPWVTRTLFEHVLIPHLPAGARGLLKHRAGWEPACNRGHMAKPMREYLGRVVASDLFAYGWPGQEAVCDFLPVMGAAALPPSIRRFRDRLYAGDRPIDWIITNPPFPFWTEFALQGLALRPMSGLAMLGRLGAITGQGRYRDLYAANPPTVFAPFTERCNLVPGGLDPKADMPHLYAWFVWLPGEARLPPVFIPPCRHQLERAGDYDGAAPAPKPAKEHSA